MLSPSHLLPTYFPLRASAVFLVAIIVTIPFQSWGQRIAQTENSISDTSTIDLQLATSLLDEAIEHWLSLDDATRKSEQNLGIALVKQQILTGDLPAALAAIKKCGLPLDANGNTSFSIRQRLIQLQVAKGETQAAVSTLGPMPIQAENFSVYLESKVLLSKAFANSGDFDNAIQYATQIKKLMTLPTGTTFNGSYRRSIAFEAIISQLVNSGKIAEARQFALEHSEDDSEHRSHLETIAFRIAMNRGVNESYQFCKSNLTGGNLHDCVRTVVHRVTGHERPERALDLLLLASADSDFDANADVCRSWLMNLGNMLFYGKENQLYEECLLVIEGKVAKLEPELQTELRYKLGCCYGGINLWQSALDVTNELGDGGDAENVFVQDRASKLRQDLFERKLTIEQAVQVAHTFRTVEQQQDIIESLVRSMRHQGRIEETRILVSEHIKFANDREYLFGFAYLLDSDLEFEERIANESDMETRNYLRKKRALVAAHEDDGSNALEWLEQLEEINPGEACHDVTRVLSKRGQYPIAIQCLAKIPDRDYATKSAAIFAAEKLGKHDFEATNQLISLAREQDMEISRLCLIHYLTIQVSLERVNVEPLQFMQKLNPEMIDCDRALAWTYGRSGNGDLAVQHAVAANGKDQHSASLNYSELRVWGNGNKLLIAALESGNEDRLRVACSLQETALDKLDPENPELVSSLIESIRNLDDPAFQALAFLQLVEKLRPSPDFF